MKTTIYVLVIEDNVPIITEMSEIGTANIAGKVYWLVPATTGKPQHDDSPPLSTWEQHGYIPAPIRDNVGRVLTGVHREQAISALTEARTANLSEQDKRILALNATGTNSVLAIAREVGVAPYQVTRTIELSGAPTPADRVRKKMEDALLEAGDRGMTPHELQRIAGDNMRIGPILGGMLRRKAIKRLSNKNWAVNA